MSSPDRDLVYVLHIEERIARIEEIAERGKDEFFHSHILQDAIALNFEVIGEAAKQLSDEIKSTYPAVSWQRVAGFRDVLIHNYMGIDLDEVWNVIVQALPTLKSTIARARKEMEGGTELPK